MSIIDHTGLLALARKPQREALVANYKAGQRAIKYGHERTAYIYLEWVRAHRQRWNDYAPF